MQVKSILYPTSFIVNSFELHLALARAAGNAKECRAQALEAMRYAPNEAARKRAVIEAGQRLRSLKLRFGGEL